MGDEEEWDRGPTNKPGFRAFINQADGKAPGHRVLTVHQRLVPLNYAVLGVDFTLSFFLTKKETDSKRVA